MTSVSYYYTVEDLANTAWAFAAASQSNAQIFKASARAAEHRLGDFNVQDLSMGVYDWAIAETKLANSSSWVSDRFLHAGHCQITMGDYVCERVRCTVCSQHERLRLRASPILMCMAWRNWGNRSIFSVSSFPFLPSFPPLLFL